MQHLWIQYCRFKIDDPDLPFHKVTRYDSAGKLMTVLDIPVGEGVIFDYNFVDYGDYLNLNLMLDSYIWGFIYHRFRVFFWEFVGDKQPAEFEYEEYWVVRRRL